MEGDRARSLPEDVSTTVKGQAVYNGVKTTPSLTVAGSNKSFLTANAYTLGYGRNLNDEDVDLVAARRRDRQDDREATFPARIADRENDQDSTGTPSPSSACWAKRDGVRPKPGRYLRHADHAVLRRFRRSQTDGEHRDAIVLAETYNRTFDKGIGAMRIARGLKADQHNDFEIYSNDSLKSAFASIAGVVRIGAFVISLIALLAAGIGIMNIMLVSVTERTKEIGIRKSIGARSRDILRQFLTEAVFISEAGGIIGILLGVIGGDLLALGSRSI